MGKVMDIPILELASEVCKMVNYMKIRGIWEDYVAHARALQQEEQRVKELKLEINGEAHNDDEPTS
jgi:NMD protein affecting ribosome stability and mRNA decay